MILTIIFVYWSIWTQYSALCCCRTEGSHKDIIGALPNSKTKYPLGYQTASHGWTHRATSLPPVQTRGSPSKAIQPPRSGIDSSARKICIHWSIRTVINSSSISVSSPWLPYPQSHRSRIACSKSGRTQNTGSCTGAGSEKRKIYEWILEPVFSMTGKI